MKKYVASLFDGILGSPNERALTEQFIISFCDDGGDRLSQWRGYGPYGGYAIGFDRSDLDELKQYQHDSYWIDSAHFDSVVYGGPHKMPDVLALEAGRFMELLNRWEKGEKNVLKEAIEAFGKCLFLFKHEGLEEENEVRLIFSIPDIIGRELETDETRKPKEIRFRRTSTGLLAPYVELHAETGVLPIRRVVVGPAPDARLRKESMQLLLSTKGIDPNIVDVSTIPYRGR